MKTYFAALLLVAAALTIGGCNGSDAHDPGEAPAEAAAPGGVEPTQRL